VSDPKRGADRPAERGPAGDHRSAGPRALITGGTGFLGEHLARVLLARGDEVAVLSRGPADSLRDLGAEVIAGDVVRDLQLPSPPAVKAKRGQGRAAATSDLHTALAGREVVYHLAGFVSRDPDDGQRMMRVHVDGTRRVLEAAKQAGVGRVVIASTSGTIAVSRDPEPILDERAPYPMELISGWAYYLSKVYQEKLALDLGRSLGLEVVIVNPSLLLGPGDARQSSTGDVRRFLRREVPVVPDGGLSFVDVRDAAHATVAAMDRGRPFERYLLGGPNWTFAEFFGRLERISKVRRPWLRLPPAAQRTGATILQHLYRAVNRAAPIDRVSVEMAQRFWYCDSTKAERELGFVARDPSETLDETVRDLRGRMI
jgi:dihydroflavonol-4-reductase